MLNNATSFTAQIMPTCTKQIQMLFQQTLLDPKPVP